MDMMVACREASAGLDSYRLVGLSPNKGSLSDDIHALTQGLPVALP